MDLVTRGMQIRAVRAETREADFIASTDAIDSYDEVVNQNWRLERYASNPVVLYAHNSRELPIGKSIRCGVVNGALECTVKFATADANPEADKVWKLVQQDILRAVSVGFVPHTVTRELRNDREIYVLDDNELMEISVVPIPANPEALAKMRARAIAKETTPMLTQKEIEERQVLDARVVAAEKSLADLTTEHATLTEKHAALVLEHATVEASLAQANVQLTALAQSEKDAKDALLVKEVADLVGTKILPVEQDEMVELARTNRSLFDKLIAKRPNLGLLDKSPITTEPKPNENTASTAPNGDDLMAEVAKTASQLASEN